MKRKVMILANNSSGLYDFRKELIEEIRKTDDVVVSVPAGDKVDDLKQLGVKFIDTPVDRRGVNPIRDYKLLVAYFKLLKKESPNMVITYTIKPNVYGGMVARILRIPYAINITGLGTAFQKSGVLRTVVVKLYKLALKKAKVVFFENSENMQAFLEEKIVNPKQCCLLNGAGVNLEKYSLAPYPKERGIIRFLFMGRVMREKGVEELFGACRRLYNEGYSIILDVLGNCEEDYKDLLLKYETEGWLKYHGYQLEVRPFIENAHCFVLPSWHEGMANTNLECAAMGRPVITSNIHGCKEAVIDGVSGYLCEKKNSESLYQMMKRFILLSHQEKIDMGKYGRKHMEAVFDKKNVVKETIKKI